MCRNLIRESKNRWSQRGGENDGFGEREKKILTLKKMRQRDRENKKLKYMHLFVSNIIKSFN